MLTISSLSVTRITLSVTRIVCRHPSILRERVTRIILPPSVYAAYFILSGIFMREISSLGNAGRQFVDTRLFVGVSKRSNRSRS